MKYINKLFGIYSNGEEQFFYFLGKKFVFNKIVPNIIPSIIPSIQSQIDTLKYQLLIANQKMISTAFLHQKTFLQYKNINQGKDVVLIGAGPSLKDFKPINNAVYVGVNRVFLYDKVDFDYWFTIDKAGICMYYNEFRDYVNSNNHCKFFIGNQDGGIEGQIPESYILSLKQDNILRYNTDTYIYKDSFTYDISTQPLKNCCTVSLPAMQFILYTNPKRIFLVGIDCNISTGGHFKGEMYDIAPRGESIEKNDIIMVEEWKNLKEFRDIYYPDTEIISVNPVGLKGVFQDVYTKSYLDTEKINANVKLLEI